MKLSNLEEGTVVCFRYVNWKDWVLICPLTKEIKNAYAASHKKPITSNNYNIEPFFKNAIYECIEKENQTLENLRIIYSETPKKTSRTKMFEHDFFLTLWNKEEFKRII